MENNNEQQVILQEILSETNVSSNDSTINKNTEKRKRVRNRALKFKKERQEILEELYNILNINDNNYLFYSHKLTEDIKNKILALEENIKLYFNTSPWTVLQNNSLKIKNKALSIIKHILKDMNIEYVTNSYLVKDDNGNLIGTTEYKIIKIL